MNFKDVCTNAVPVYVYTHHVQLYIHVLLEISIHKMLAYYELGSIRLNFEHLL